MHEIKYVLNWQCGEFKWRSIEHYRSSTHNFIHKSFCTFDLIHSVSPQHTCSLSIRLRIIIYHIVCTQCTDLSQCVCICNVLYGSLWHVYCVGFVNCLEIYYLKQTSQFGVILEEGSCEIPVYICRCCFSILFHTYYRQY